jgi:hypothetical protein
MPPDLLPWILALGLLVYGALGGFVAGRLWPPSQSPDPGGEPAAYAAYWFPGLTALLIYAWVGAVMFAVCLLLFTPVLHGPDASAVLLGAGIGLGGFALLIGGLILWGHRRLQRLGRRSSATPANGASEA